MRRFPKLITLLACLLAYASVGTTSGGDAAQRHDQKHRAFLQRFDLIQSPVHLPPKRDPAVVCQEESGIDEEDSDKIENAMALTQRYRGIGFFGPSLPIVRFSLGRLPIVTEPIAAFLRC